MLICSLIFFSLLTISSNGIEADSSTKLIVKISAGIYYFSDSLYLKSNVELKGDSKNNTKLVLNHAIATEAVHEKMSSGLGVKDISISGSVAMFKKI
ncbi:hypothetical protein ICM_05500 [Bacillus cereus BAG1X2-3]|uniref:Uncharacterized protein n=2 Tax=Bacillus cereus TaxID=1396 RepID=A0A9X7E7Z4_BACCE|nr:hypothetical protein [Bacillus cereus]EOO42988.1 hypothetical protein ICI_06081 [Bacillus cereus BAG1X2-1]EOO23379.1 hypothetical protein ICC_06135 [Bacillus cereus BAG1X1-1]EOO56590.1 hypothetical protein ICM_05500 [Bacillus cereus BAG1X2-3]EOP00009.1 hypothetical protein ICO_06554 [Bacillus cereus BAG2O-1]PHA10688.1 hypothetical protein COE70_30805 [Bacillus cereus]